MLSQPCLQSARVGGEAAGKMKKSIAPLSKTRRRIDRLNKLMMDSRPID
jgi:hypothetical protein